MPVWEATFGAASWEVLKANLHWQYVSDPDATLVRQGGLRSCPRSRRPRAGR